jgi:S1-C subfamily serine protease
MKELILENLLQDHSAAKEAGIKEGDVVVKINETPIRSSSALIETVGKSSSGRQAKHYR